MMEATEKIVEKNTESLQNSIEETWGELGKKVKDELTKDEITENAAIEEWNRILKDDYTTKGDYTTITENAVIEEWNGILKGDYTTKGDSNTESEQQNDANENDAENVEAPESNVGLTDDEKDKIKQETGWSDEIIDAIGSMEEYEIYKNAGLIEAEIDGRKCLIRNDIDWDQKDAMGRTNKERAEQGLSPINKDGKVIELHHIGQHSDSPLAELTPEEHRGKESDVILHDKTKESEIDRKAFAGERNAHWEARANEEGDK